MKKSCFILIVLCMTSSLKAQLSDACLPYGITFNNQAQIDSFQVNYPGCARIEGDVIISGANITNLNSLIALTSIGGDLNISYNNALTSLSGLNNIDSILGSFNICANPLLINLTGLDNLTFIQYDFNFGGMFFPNGCCGNPAIIDFTGLSSLTSINGSISIICSDSLTSLTGLESLTSIGGSLNIIKNYALTSLTGLEGLNFMGGSVYFFDNNSLISLAGLDNLTSIGGWLQIESTWALKSLAGLENLTSIGGGLIIKYNESLTSLTGLDNIVANTISNLHINNNPSLSNCAVQSICNYLAAPNGYIEIYNNATGCNSHQEVDSACVYLSNGEMIIKPAFFISPNPASATITIATPATSNNNTFATIFNISGQQFIKHRITEKETVLDVSGLVSGVYFVRVTDDKTVQVGKFVKK